jgi:hypothetical protein
MPLSSKLDRKLRAAEESSDEEEYYEVTDRSSSASVIEFGDTEEIPSSGEDGEGSEDEEMVRSLTILKPRRLTHKSLRKKTNRCRHKLARSHSEP